jgi:hypothetical protein
LKMEIENKWEGELRKRRNKKNGKCITKKYIYK